MGRVTTYQQHPTFATRRLPLEVSREWVVQEEDPATVLQRQLGDWLKDVSESEALFKKHVYDNDELADSDLRQHRSRICFLIGQGDLLALGFSIIGERLGKENETKPPVSLIDQKLKQLFETLLAWHGPLATQSDIPESFKQAALEVEQGNVVDMDV